MKKGLKRLAAAVCAAAFAAASTLGAEAQKYYSQFDPSTSYTDKLTIRVNKPYLNITVDKGDIEDNSVYFTLKKDGVSVGTFTLSTSSFTFNAFYDPNGNGVLNVYDITGVSDDTALMNKVGAWSEYAENLVDSFSISGLNVSTPLSVHPNGVAKSIPEENWSTVSIGPNGSCYLGYFDTDKYQLTSAGTMTVPSGNFVISATDRYAYRYGDNAVVSLLDNGTPVSEAVNGISLTGTSGSRMFDNISAGNYVLSLCNTYNLNNADVTVSNSSETYIKVRIPVSMIDGVTENNHITNINNNTEYNLGPVGYDNESNPLVYSYCFVSGSVVSCDTPDDNGFLEIWVKESDPYTQLHSVFDLQTVGKTGVPLRYELRYDRVHGLFAYPQNGVTLYNISEGKYTVEMHNEKYELTGDTSLNVTKTKELQQMNLVIRAKQTEPEDPNGGNTDPSGGNTNPSGGNTDPSGGNTNPSGGNTNPSGGNTNPSGGNTNPSGGNTNPSGGNTTPSGGNTTPSGGNTTPSGGNTTPSGGNTTPSGGNTTPSGGNNNQQQQAPVTGASAAFPAFGTVGAAFAVVTAKKRKARK